MTQVTSLLPLLAAVVFAAVGLYQILPATGRRKAVWLFPASLALVFFLFSLNAGLREGPLGFWVEHTRNLWGNQIWFDLLIGVGIGWYLIVPRAKAVRMNLIFWLVFILATGGIGFLAMLARLLYLEERAK